MRRKVGRLCMVLGLAMVLSAVFLFAYNKNEAFYAAQGAASILENVKTTIVKDDTSFKAPLPPPGPVPVKPGAHILHSVEIDGYGYIGYLSIPDLGLELPVMDEWDYARLKIAPCRQCGETTDDLIIAGHNYERHFGLLKTLAEGAPVRFTDMGGNVTDYEVKTIETVTPVNADKIPGSKWNLVLYTCTYSGYERIVVGCDRV